MPDGPFERWTVERLNADHDRAIFVCGHASLDDYIRKFASQNERTGISQMSVALGPDARRVCGYYSLAAGSIEIDDLTDAQRKRLPRYPIPVAHLGHLAVDVHSRGRGLGEHLLMDALERIVRVAGAIGIHAVEVIAIDERARSFYCKYGFSSLRDGPQHMYLPMKQVRRLGLI